ncbi:hypothetical protein [Actinomadura sp. J1-007]|uniref:hypothetical protein n=1 Tax=Actinomadura sp. J1-007 TaxID=2661913 RepID=UPI0013DEDA02|nr:hypothetical protein [Actinomadura sp. J1-007]
MGMTEGSNAADRVVVVAGASGPAGRAAVRRLAADGSRVVAAARTPGTWDEDRVSPPPWTCWTPTRRGPGRTASPPSTGAWTG